MPGYEKFTLSEVIYPGDKKEKDAVSSEFINANLIKNASPSIIGTVRRFTLIFSRERNALNIFSPDRTLKVHHQVFFLFFKNIYF